MLSVSVYLDPPLSWQAVSLWWAPCCVWRELLLWQAVFRGAGSVHQLLRRFCQEVRSKQTRPAGFLFGPSLSITTTPLTFVYTSFVDSTQLTERHVVYFDIRSAVLIFSYKYSEPLVITGVMFLKNLWNMKKHNFWMCGIKKSTLIFAAKYICMIYLYIHKYLWFLN